MSFNVTEISPIIGYVLKNTQAEMISTKGTPGTPETPIPDTYTVIGSNVVAETFTAPIDGKPSKTTDVLKASRTNSDEFIVHDAFPPPTP